MTKNSSKNVVNEATYSAVAKQFIKYDGEFIKTGCQFKVKVSDTEELKDYAEIDKTQEVTDNSQIDPGQSDNNSDGAKQEGTNPDENENPDSKNNSKGKDNPKAGA